MAVGQFRHPGSRLTTNNRLAQMLMQMDRGAAPIQSHPQGLAHMLRMGLAGWSMGKDRRQREAVDEALVGALQPVAQTPEQDAAGIPAATTRERLQGAITGVAGNPYAGSLTRALLEANMGREQAITTRDEERAYQRGLARTARTNKEIDDLLAQQRKLEQIDAQYGSGPFRGNNPEIQYQRILHSSDPSSPEYLQAYKALARGVPKFDPYTQTTTQVQMDMTGIIPPTGMSAGAPAGTGAPGAGLRTAPPAVTGPPTQPPADPDPTITPGGGQLVSQAQPAQVAQAGDADMPESLRTPYTIPPGMNPNSPAAMELRKLEQKRLSEVRAWRKDRAARDAKADKKIKAKAVKARAANTVIQDVGRALELVEQNPNASGPLAMIAQFNPMADAFVVQGHVQSALSNVGLDTLQAMRESSPTGGALGQVPVQQQKRLEQVLGSLKVYNPRGVQIDNLKRVHNIYRDIIHGTPDQIDAAVRAGKISPEDGARLGRRYELSFDEEGRSKQLPVPEGVSEEDIQATMSANRMSREEVLRELQRQRGGR